MDPQGDFLEALLIKNTEISIELVITFNTSYLERETYRDRMISIYQDINL